MGVQILSQLRCKDGGGHMSAAEIWLAVVASVLALCALGMVAIALVAVLRERW